MPWGRNMVSWDLWILNFTCLISFKMWINLGDLHKILYRHTRKIIKILSWLTCGYNVFEFTALMWMWFATRKCSVFVKTAYTTIYIDFGIYHLNYYRTYNNKVGFSWYLSKLFQTFIHKKVFSENFLICKIIFLLQKPNRQSIYCVRGTYRK